MLRHLLYTSRATEGVDLRDVYEIIRVSHNRNSKAGLTGGLIFLEGYFYQLLEGLPAAVQDRYDRIQQDARHTQVELRIDKLSETTLFESDWMAMRDGYRIDPDLLEPHVYERGMPADRFDADQVLDFVMACFASEEACLES